MEALSFTSVFDRLEEGQQLDIEWHADLETSYPVDQMSEIEDRFHYLLPESMKQVSRNFSDGHATFSSSGSRSGSFGSRNGNFDSTSCAFSVHNTYLDQALLALEESDTNSECSDWSSKLESQNLLGLKLEGDFHHTVGKAFETATHPEEIVFPWEFQSSVLEVEDEPSLFEKSLQTFLDWPTNDASTEYEGHSIDYVNPKISCDRNVEHNASFRKKNNYCSKKLAETSGNERVAKNISANVRKSWNEEKVNYIKMHHNLRMNKVNEEKRQRKEKLARQTRLKEQEILAMIYKDNLHSDIAADITIDEDRPSELTESVGSETKSESDAGYKTLSDTSSDKSDRQLKAKSQKQLSRVLEKARRHDADNLTELTKTKLSESHQTLPSCSNISSYMYKGSLPDLSHLLTQNDSGLRERSEFKGCDPGLNYFPSHYQNLLELLGNNDGELDRFRNLLRTAELSLEKSEKAVEVIFFVSFFQILRCRAPDNKE